MHPQGLLARIIRGEAAPHPIMTLLGWKFVDYDASTSTLKVEMLARPEFLNPLGFVHGGMLGAMLDETMAPAVAATLDADELSPTLEIKTSFIASASPGPIIGIGRVINRGRSICFTEGQLLDPSGRLIATASATFKIVRRPPQPTSSP